MTEVVEILRWTSMVPDVLITNEFKKEVKKIVRKREEEENLKRVFLL